MSIQTHDIHHSIAKVVETSIKEDWSKAVLTIEYLPKSKGYKGYYLDQQGNKKQLRPKPPFELAYALDA